MADFRPMRRKRQALARAECLRILAGATSGVLALIGDGGYPYAVPLSFAYAGDRLYFHSAPAGHKIDAVRKGDGRASFCVVGKDEIHGSEYTTYFCSVIAFGRIGIVEDQEEKLAAARLLGARYNPGDEAGLQKELDKSLSHMLMLRLDIEHMTGKEAIELARRRQPQTAGGQV